MKSEIFWPLLVLLVLTAITVFGLLPLRAAPLPIGMSPSLFPAPHTFPQPKPKNTAVAKPARPVIRLGQPYRAELYRAVPHREGKH